MSRSDVELLMRLKDDATRAEAFGELVDRFERRLIGYFYAMGGHRQLAEDCAQEVFLRVYRAREHYTPDASASTFVFRIARNYWIDVYRSRKIRPFEHSLDPADPETDDGRYAAPYASESARPDESAVASENEERLRKAIRQLPEAQQAVLELAVRQGLKYEEISSIMDIPVGTVKSRVHAAVQHLRRSMGVPEPESSP